jgi:hypothetical protein
MMRKPSLRRDKFEKRRLVRLRNVKRPNRRVAKNATSSFKTTGRRDMRDYMLITHPAGRTAYPGGQFFACVRQAIGAARKAFPAVTWQADFPLGPRDYVEVFSAPDESMAQEVAAVVSTLGGITAEVSPLRSNW